MYIKKKKKKNGNHCFERLPTIPKQNFGFTRVQMLPRCQLIRCSQIFYCNNAFPLWFEEKESGIRKEKVTNLRPNRIFIDWGG